MKRGLEIIAGRDLVIATMHGKEKMIAPLLTRELGLSCLLAHGLDTDQFGTFSGEIHRQGSPLEAARKKALAALAGTPHSLAVASEGSFGPHPHLFFIPADEELVLLIDTKENVEIVGYHLTENTNFSHTKIATLEDLHAFVEKVMFPSHGIILKAKGSDKEEKILKDLLSVSILEQKVEELLNQGFTIQAETDMRAMRNPTRQQAIELATLDLVQKVKSLCPQCQSPGFAVTSTIAGLPCRQCNSPTRSVKALIYACSRCDYTMEKINPAKIVEEPMYCDYCNP